MASGSDSSAVELEVGHRTVRITNPERVYFPTRGETKIDLAGRTAHEPRWSFADVRRAARAFAREVQRRAPELVTTAWWKRDRIDAVFVDWNQNTRDHTIRSAYSVRGVSEAVVSTPLRWDEIPDAEPGDFTLATMPERFARLGDVHAGIDEAVFSLEPLLEWAQRDEREAH